MSSSRPLRLLVITYYWPPSGGAGVQRCLKFVKHLGHFNVEPTVITVAVDQATYPVLDESLLAEVSPDVHVIRTKTSEPFESYKKLTGRAVPYGGFANEGKPGLMQKALRFVRGNLFIPDPRRGWNRHALAAVEKLLATGEQFDAVLTSSPPHSTQLIGLELKRRHGLRWLADMRDPWTDIYYYKDLHHTLLASWLDARYERRVLTEADAVLVTSPETKRLFSGQAAGLASRQISRIAQRLRRVRFPSAFAIAYRLSAHHPHRHHYRALPHQPLARSRSRLRRRSPRRAAAAALCGPGFGPTAWAD